MKQVIVMRKDLNMRKGKMVAQGAHASVQATVNNMKNKDVKSWLATGMKKICVGCDSEEELLSLYAKAVEAKVPHSIIRDAGHTEFDEPTLTCIAIGPAADDKIDAITKDLKLL